MVIKGAIIVLAFVAFLAFMMVCVCIATIEDEDDYFMQDDYWQVDEFDSIKEEGDEDATAP